MALSLVQVYARSGWRVRAVYAGGNPSGAVPTDFVFARQDGGPTTVTALAVVVVDGNSVELATSERLISGVIYTVTWSGTTLSFSFFPQIELAPSVQAPDDDPDAEANGVDWAWISGNPTASGDCPRRSGIACVEYDLPNRAVLIPGELVQDQTAGGGLLLKVNGAMTDAELQRAAGGLENEFKRDRRVKDCNVDTTSSTDGSVNFNGQVQTRAGQQALVRSQ